MIKNQLEVIGMYKGNVFKEYSVSTTKQSDYIVKKQLQIPFKNEEVIKHHLMRALQCAEKSVSVKDHDLNYPLVMGWHVYDAPSDNKQVVRLLKKELAWDCFNEYRNKDWFVDIENKLKRLE